MSFVPTRGSRTSYGASGCRYDSGLNLHRAVEGLCASARGPVLFQIPAQAEALNYQQICPRTAMLFSADPACYGLRSLQDPLYMFLYMFGFINLVKSSDHLPQTDENFPRTSPNP